MGDVGWMDEQGRLWFCGRKSHRVVLPNRTLFTDQCEPIFNRHPQVFRTALVGVVRNSKTIPVLCVELTKDSKKVEFSQVRSELIALGSEFPHTAEIQDFLLHPGFPVDVRHNAKIFREQLAQWAAQVL
jgi:acyl-coenzyme A synthetase/AMP-(fatty) acid ligase